MSLSKILTVYYQFQIVEIIIIIISLSLIGDLQLIINNCMHIRYNDIITGIYIMPECISETKDWFYYIFSKHRWSLLIRLNSLNYIINN